MAWSIRSRISCPTALKQGAFQVADVKATARALFDATSRFHHPAHAEEWNDPQRRRGSTPCWRSCSKALKAPRKR